MPDSASPASILDPLLNILKGVATTGKTPAERILGIVLLFILVVGLVALAIIRAPAALDGGVAGLGILLLHEWGKD